MMTGVLVTTQRRPDTDIDTERDREPEMEGIRIPGDYPLWKSTLIDFRA